MTMILISSKPSSRYFSMLCLCCDSWATFVNSVRRRLHNKRLFLFACIVYNSYLWNKICQIEKCFVGHAGLLEDAKIFIIRVPFDF